MMQCVQLTQPDAIQRLRDNYLHTLIAPMDGMWESVAITFATFWEIRDHEQLAGHFCTDTNNGLLRFHLLKDYQGRAQEIFRWVISTYAIHYAIVSTIEPLYFSLCLDVQRSMAVQSYLFRDNRCIELSSSLSSGTFRKAEKSELEAIIHFYRAHTEEAGEWLEGFVRERLDRKELFVLYDQQMLVGTGECIASQTQPPYADLGMAVARSYRGRGLGSFVLSQLKQHCYAENLRPICSCVVDNHASKKAIEKAGFISAHRMVKVEW